VENVIAVGVHRTNNKETASNRSIDELRELIETAGGYVVETHIQNKEHPDRATFIGKGKVSEIAERARVLKVHTVVFDDELKPAQQKNLEELLNTKVIDRTRLILDIFAQRARTREGILQVELAQLTYSLPRITAHFGRFEQQTGGIGTRGPGERKLEVDQRRIYDRIAALKKDIEKISQERSLQREVRRGVPVPQVAIIGYTNAGKSTLLNTLLNQSAALPDADYQQVYADDKLFATLDPTTRRIRMPSSRIVLFSDTVGFIQKLPTALVAAFRATIEEIGTADLLLHVIDASDAEKEQQEKSVQRLLEDLHLHQLPRLKAYNKIDALSPEERMILSGTDSILISAKTGEGIEDLKQTIEKKLTEKWEEHDLHFQFDQEREITQLYALMDILTRKTTTTGYDVRVRVHPQTFAQWSQRRTSH